MFLSCRRSNVHMSFDVAEKDGEFVATLLIEGKTISHGYASIERGKGRKETRVMRAKKKACGKAFGILRECQPSRFLTIQESPLKKDEQIAGLTLYLPHPKDYENNMKIDRFNILMHSLKRCNLDVRWLTDDKCIFTK